MLSVEFCQKNSRLEFEKVLSKKTVPFIMGLDMYLLNLNSQMLIDHGSFQSVQMLWSLNWNKYTVLIIMQTSIVCLLQILITSLALFSRECISNQHMMGYM